MAHEPGHVDTGYVAPAMPEGGSQNPVSSRYIGGFPGDTRVPGPTTWGPWVPGQWRSPSRSESMSLDELRANQQGGYQIGDEWLPVNEDESVIEDLQRRLFQAGLLDGDDEITPGYFDDTTRAAFKRLLERSNGMRTDWLSALETLRTNPLPADAPDAPQPFVAQVSNPDDIRKKFIDTLTEATGTGAISPEELQSIVAEYQGKQVASQRSQYDAYASGQGGTVVAPPSFEVFAEEKAKEKNPVGFRAHEYLDKFSAISEMLGGASAVSS